MQSQIAAAINTNLSGGMLDNAWWRAAVTAPDQLRQRVAFALSEILVVSDTNATLSGRPDALASYYDTLADNAFGNFRDLLKAATLHPTMGYWLNMQGNAKGNLTTGYHPNENYGREVMQLFSIGLNRLWPDGSLVLDASGNLVPTYNQGVITNGFARVFTGWTWHQAAPSQRPVAHEFLPGDGLARPHGHGQKLPRTRHQDPPGQRGPARRRRLQPHGRRRHRLPGRHHHRRLRRLLRTGPRKRARQHLLPSRTSAPTSAAS